MALHDPMLVVTVSTEITLWVPRGAAGDLAAGAREVLASADPVDSIDQLDVVGFRPTATDIRVDLTAVVHVYAADPDVDRVEAALADGFGIITADVTTIRREN
jgi:hypothetical protein